MSLRKIFGTLLIGSALSTALVAPGQAETIRVGSTPTGVPFTFLDVKSQKITGFMVDVTDAIAKEEGITAEINSLDWVSLIPALKAHRIDMIAAAMSITDKRKEIVDFSDPVLPYGEALVVRKGDDTDFGEDLSGTKGKKIGAQQGSIYVDLLKKMDGIGEVKVYDNTADLLRDVQLGRIACAMVDKPIIAYQMGEGKFPELQLSPGYKSQFVVPIGLAVDKGNKDLLKKVDDGLAKIKASGELDKIIAKWKLG